MQAHQNPAATFHAAAAQQHTLASISDAFMAAYTGRDNSIGSRVDYWVTELGDKPLVEINEDDLDRVLHQIAKGYAQMYKGGATTGGNVVPLPRQRSPATVNRYRASLASVIKWARAERLIPKRWESPIKHTDRLPEAQGRLRYLTPDEYDRLRKAARVSDWPRMWLFITLAVTTGARRGALEALKWSDVDLEAKRALIERTKNGTPFVLVLTDAVVAEMRKFHREGTDELVFRGKAKPDRVYSLRDPFLTCCRRAKIDGVCIHTLRHSHASWLAQNGASLVQIADSMNHKSMAMVKRYAHLAVDDRAKTIAAVFG